jgi:hypothetical protein
MNTKILMTSSSFLLGLAGGVTLFAPDSILSMLSMTVTAQSLLSVQMMGAFYFSFALMNWAAKDSAIGGVYARPVSLANFGHFFVGTLLLVKYQISNPFNAVIAVTLIVYVVFASMFYWLVFRATGIAKAG